MSWSNEKQTAYLLTAISFLGTTLKGVIGGRFSKLVRRAVMPMADGHIYPIARPVIAIDAIVVARFMDQASAVSETTAAGQVVYSFNKADGQAGSLTVGNFVAGDVEHEFEGREGFPVQQHGELEGTALTYTPSV